MNIDELLKIGIEREASDVHLKVGQHPTLRIHGILYPLTGLERLSARDAEEVVEDLLNDYQKKKLRENMDVDFAYSLSGYGRFRGNIFMQRGTLAVSMRIIPFEVKSLRELLLPDALEKICDLARGLV
ncbi:MAG: type IV pili twitching motility protein PilT, partial [Candidatus Aminicenantales bacterium]